MGRALASAVVTTLTTLAARPTLAACLAGIAAIGCSSSDAAADPSAASSGGRRADAGASVTSGGQGNVASGGAAAHAGGAPGTSGAGGTGVGGAGATTAGSGGAPGADGGAPGADGGAPLGGPRVSDFVGINAFIDDDVAALAAVGNVREYHNWAWNDGNGVAGYAGYPKNELEFSLWGGFWDFDDYYAKLTKAGALVFPCIQGSVDYLKNAMPPVAASASETDPASYVAHASFLYQYAARYGRTKVPSDRLKLKSGQVVATGTGLLPYYENGNEPDANWVKPGSALLFSPEATAAMSSADYDGHRGSLGPSVGLKTADPGAKLVLAGLAGSGPGDWVTNVTTYLDAIRAWSSKERGGSFPADVINVHEYCFGPDAFGTKNPRPGLSPEECGLEALLRQIVQYRDAKLPGKELWLTEFGYDTHPRSRLRAPAIGAASAEVVQGQWLLRSVLALLASGIDRAFLFVSRDSCTGSDTKCPDNAVQFSTSGVFAEKGNAAPKVAFYYLATFRNRLGSMRYVGTQSVNGVSLATFRDPETGKGAAVFWMPTSDGRSLLNLPLTVPAGPVSLVTLGDQSVTGTETKPTIVSGNAIVKATETPAILLYEGAP